jgi:hypothetical protein
MGWGERSKERQISHQARPKYKKRCQKQVVSNVDLKIVENAVFYRKQLKKIYLKDVF